MSRAHRRAVEETAAARMLRPFPPPDAATTCVLLSSPSANSIRLHPGRALEARRGPAHEIVQVHPSSALTLGSVTLAGMIHQAATHDHRIGAAPGAWCCAMERNPDRPSLCGEPWRPDRHRNLQL